MYVERPRISDVSSTKTNKKRITQMAAAIKSIADSMKEVERFTSKMREIVDNLILYGDVRIRIEDDQVRIIKEGRDEDSGGII